MTAPLEIERVFVLDRMPLLPDVAGIETLRLEQGYLPDADEADDAVEGRIRRMTNEADGSVSCRHTVKRGLGLVREETERAITNEEFDSLWPRTAGRRISKTRTRVPVGARIWEIDVFDDLDLVLAEVELDAPDATVVLPEWLKPHVVREVTEDPSYRNFELAPVGEEVEGTGTGVALVRTLAMGEVSRERRRVVRLVARAAGAA